MGFLTAVGLASLIPRYTARRLFKRSKNRANTNQKDEPCHPRRKSHRWAPLFAGLTSPFSILLEIPALTEHFYKGPDQGVFTPDILPSTFLVTALVLSLISGFVANLALITRYFEHRPQISTLTAIGSLTIHDLINLSILIVSPIQLGTVRSDQSLGYGYWLLVASSIISVSCNTALIYDYCLVDNFRAKGSGLTNKQRSLVIACMALVMYIGFGALIFIFLTEDNIKFIDALYFCVCTVTTVGFGDVIPTNTGSRIFVFFFAIFGIITLGLTINTARETIIEGFESLWQTRRNAIFEFAREYRTARKAAKKRSSGVTTGLSVALMMSASVSGRNSCLSGAHSHNPPPSNRPLFSEADRKNYLLAHRLDTENTTSTSSMENVDNFKSFSERLLKQERREFQTKLVVAAVLFSCFWLIGSFVFKVTEGWNYGQALYFCYVAFLTLGYGDITVKTPAGRCFFIAWSLMGIASMTLLLSVLAEGWEAKYKRIINKKRRLNSHNFRLIRTKVTSQEDLENGPNQMQTVPLVPPIPVVLDSSPEDLPQRLIDTARGFFSHAQFWMEGKTGNPPPALSELMEQVGAIDGIEKFRDKGGLAERMMSEDRQKMLFLMSFARSLEVLINTAEETAEAMRVKIGEVDGVMRPLSPNSSNAHSNSHPEHNTSSLTFVEPYEVGASQVGSLIGVEERLEVIREDDEGVERPIDEKVNRHSANKSRNISENQDRTANIQPDRCQTRAEYNRGKVPDLLHRPYSIDDLILQTAPRLLNLRPYKPESSVLEYQVPDPSSELRHSNILLEGTSVNPPTTPSRLQSTLTDTEPESFDMCRL
ncbi:uncharacterized protein MELLADRAFT_84751 [Melampsora larici-populina 98AG31]|uniref:Potassium channel domain-containing protein n=1 Tax=Melampsora larici-populina (strain 98AG31 / pathotype 3-4-7) TaxID=747676 RepID=F4RG55_MELLP|nr:uncharacterized protein MELLADRAFT_84751 [Melampsora larici-populina 98AG31]EGG08551.1 hypothetical protein MELLADRAFT_84751 [Melampsora larici-populina 98AG31]